MALDPDTGELGVAVQSHWFSVGPLCAWARAGIGAVATQSVVEPAYGPNALDRLADGIPAPQALGELLAADPLQHVRQVAVIDARGELSAHTGEDCIVHAGHVTGEHHSCQANMMAGEGVPEAMSAAFTSATGLLQDRLYAALEGAESRGGDIRGRQSAAMVVVPPEGEPWRRTVDLRVEDSQDPLAELKRLLTLQRAYDLAGAGDELLAAGRSDEAGELYQAGGAPGSGLGRAALLVRPRPRPGRRPGRGGGGGQARRGDQSELDRAAGSPLSRVRPGGKSVSRSLRLPS